MVLAAEISPAGAPDAPILLDSPGNPAPDGARPGYMTVAGGLRIRHALFAARAWPRRGTVLILAGRNECIEKYFETIRDLGERGFGVAMLDWRGQGGSDRLIRDPERGHVASFDDYVADLECFFEQIVLPECPGPYYFLGHSTGSLIALLAAPAFVNRILRMVLVAPLLAFEGLPVSRRSLGRVAAMLRALGLGSAYLGWGRRPPRPVAFAANRLTTDARRYARNVELYQRHPGLGLGGPTATWVLAACRAMDRVADPAFLARIQIPALFIAAGADEVVSTRAIEAYARRLRSGAVVTVDGARHELLQEADFYREQALAAFDAFVPGSDAAEADRSGT